MKGTEEQLAGLFTIDIEFRDEMSNHLHVVGSYSITAINHKEHKGLVPRVLSRVEQPATLATVTTDDPSVFAGPDNILFWRIPP